MSGKIVRRGFTAARSRAVFSVEDGELSWRDMALQRMMHLHKAVAMGTMEWVQGLR